MPPLSTVGDPIPQYAAGEVDEVDEHSLHSSPPSINPMSRTINVCTFMTSVSNSISILIVYLHDICTPSYPTIHDDGAAPSNRLHDRRQHLQCRWCTVHLPAAMVGHYDAIHAVLKCKAAVIGG